MNAIHIRCEHKPVSRSAMKYGTFLEEMSTHTRRDLLERILDMNLYPTIGIGQTGSAPQTDRKQLSPRTSLQSAAESGRSSSVDSRSRILPFFVEPAEPRLVLPRDINFANKLRCSWGAKMVVSIPSTLVGMLSTTVHAVAVQKKETIGKDLASTTVGSALQLGTELAVAAAVVAVMHYSPVGKAFSDDTPAPEQDFLDRAAFISGFMSASGSLVSGMLFNMVGAAIVGEEPVAISDALEQHLDTLVSTGIVTVSAVIAYRNSPRFKRAVDNAARCLMGILNKHFAASMPDCVRDTTETEEV